MINFDSKYFYDLADLCTKEADKNAYQAVDDDRIDGIQEKISGLFNIPHLNLDSPELKQAGYILCNRISDLQKSLSGDSEKCALLRSKLEKAFNAIKSSLPEDYFVATPLSELGQIFESEDLITAFLRAYTQESEKDAQRFVRDLETILYRRNPDLFYKSIGSWIDMHKVPVNRIPLSYTQLLQILPHLNYVDLNFLEMHKFGFTYEECLEKYRLLLEQCQNALHLSCADGCQFEEDDITIPFNEGVFQVICNLPRLESLQLVSCSLETGKELDVLAQAPNLKCLNVRDLFSGSIFNNILLDDNLSFLTNPKLEDLTIYVKGLTNEGLKKIAACTHLKKLELIFHEEDKTHDLSCLKELTNLKSLTIRDGFFSFEDADFQFLEDLELNELCLDRCRYITNAIVSKLKTIQKLKFSCAQYITCDFVHENKALANKLEILEIKDCAKMGERSLEPLVILTKMHTLTLDFGGYGHTSSSLVALLPPLERCLSLKHLSLRKCTTTDETFRVLRKTFSHLETFEVPVNQIVWNIEDHI